MNMWKLIGIGVIIVAVIAGLEWVFSAAKDYKANKQATYDSCYAVGGIPILNHNGGFKLCLAPEAIITLDKD